MATEDTRSESELERLRTQKEIIELKAKIEELRAPWWRKAGLLAGLAAMAAAVLPITTAIQEHYQSERELTLQQSRQEAELALAQARQQTDIALEQAKQENDIRLAYLDRFEVPGHRLQTLRFLLATTTDPKLIAWAKDEHKYVEDQVKLIETELAAVKKKIEDAPPGQVLEELKKQREELGKLRASTMRQPPPAPAP